MKLREWLEGQGKNDRVTLVVEKAVKDENSPFYHNEYKTTPIWTAGEWLEGETPDKYIVINPDHPPIDVTGVWLNWYNKGRLDCCVVTTEEDLYTRYSEKQAKEMLEWYDKEVRK